MSRKIETEADVGAMLEDAIEALEVAEDSKILKSCMSFGAAGLLTGNEGIVVRFRNGRTFQITIVQS